MKKIRFILGATALLFAGCAKDVVLEPDQEHATPISFGTYVENAPQTKGTSMTLDRLKDHNLGNFGVYAFYEEGMSWDDEDYDKAHPDFMINEKVYWDWDKTEEDNENLQEAESRMVVTSNNWKYNNLKYWPVETDSDGNQTDGNVYFYAYAPYSPDWSWTGDSGTHIINLKEDVKDLVDFMYAINENVIRDPDMAESTIRDTDTAKDDNGDASIDDGNTEEESGKQSSRLQQLNRARTVLFRFSHAMSRIGFSARSDLAELGSRVIINKITIGPKETKGLHKAAGFWNKGGFKLGEVLSDKATELAQYTRGPFTATPVSNWDTEVEGAQPDVTFTLTNASGEDETGNFVDPIGAELTSEYKKINKEDSYLFVIPQDFSGEDAYLPVSIEYYIKPEEGEWDGVSYTVTGQVKHNFLQGRAYQIQIDLSSGNGPGLNPILFSVVDDFNWTEETYSPVFGPIRQITQ